MVTEPVLTKGKKKKLYVRCNNCFDGFKTSFAYVAMIPCFHVSLTS